MKIDKKELEKNQLELKVEITEAEYQPFLIKEASNISKNKHIPGFRAGKAPYDIIKQNFGEMAIFESALDDILKHFYFELVKKENLEPIGFPKIDVEKMAVGNPLVLKIVISLLPKIKLADLDKISIKKGKATVDDEEIKKAIETLREHQAKEVLVEREAKNDDKVEIDFKASVDGVVIEGGNEKNYPLVLGKGQMIPGFEDQIIGHKKNDEIKFNLKFPKDYHKNLAGKEAEFEVKLNSIYERTLPETNDEWAKTFFKLDNLKDLEEKLRENYEHEKQRELDQKQEMEMIEEIIEKSEIDAWSEDVIKEEVKKISEEFRQNIAYQGMQFEDYLKHSGKNLETLEKEFEPQAEKRLQSSLIIREVIKLQNIKTSKDEIDHEIKHMLETYKDNPEIKKQIETNEYREHIENQINSKKAVDYLKEKLIVDEK